MTIEEIYSQIGNHMIEGLMVHSQMADYYNFLGLKGYSKCHEYHFLEENCNYRKLSQYYLNHYNKIIISKNSSNSNIIPESWYKYTKQEVDSNTRKTAMQSGLEKWINWEVNTKTYYQKMYNELIAINEVAAATMLLDFIIDVDNELAEARQIHLEDKEVEFDITVIITKQDKFYKDYRKKCHNLFK